MTNRRALLLAALGLAVALAIGSTVLGGADDGTAAPSGGTEVAERTATRSGTSLDLDDLLIPTGTPEGYLLNPEATGAFGIERAAEYLFGDPNEHAWLTEHGFVDGFERTFVEPAAPYRLIATAVYRFDQADAPSTLQQIPGPLERVFAVPDFGGNVTHGTDSTAATSRRLGREVPDFVVRLDLPGHMFIMEVAGGSTTEGEAISLARRQYRRAHRLLGL